MEQEELKQFSNEALIETVNRLERSISDLAILLGELQNDSATLSVESCELHDELSRLTEDTRRHCRNDGIIGASLKNLGYNDIVDTIRESFVEPQLTSGWTAAFVSAVTATSLEVSQKISEKPLLISNSVKKEKDSHKNQLLMNVRRRGRAFSHEPNFCEDQHSSLLANKHVKKKKNRQIRYHSTDPGTEFNHFNQYKRCQSSDDYNGQQLFKKPNDDDPFSAHLLQISDAILSGRQTISSKNADTKAKILSWTVPSCVTSDSQQLDDEISMSTVHCINHSESVTVPQTVVPTQAFLQHSSSYIQSSDINSLSLQIDEALGLTASKNIFVSSPSVSVDLLPATTQPSNQISSYSNHIMSPNNTSNSQESILYHSEMPNHITATKELTINELEENKSDNSDTIYQLTHISESSPIVQKTMEICPTQHLHQQSRDSIVPKQRSFSNNDLTERADMNLKTPKQISLQSMLKENNLKQHETTILLQQLIPMKEIEEESSIGIKDKDENYHIIDHNQTDINDTQQRLQSCIVNTENNDKRFDINLEDNSKHIEDHDNTLKKHKSLDISKNIQSGIDNISEDHSSCLSVGTCQPNDQCNEKSVSMILGPKKKDAVVSSSFMVNEITNTTDGMTSISDSANDIPNTNQCTSFIKEEQTDNYSWTDGLLNIMTDKQNVQTMTMFMKNQPNKILDNSVIRTSEEISKNENNTYCFVLDTHEQNNNDSVHTNASKLTITRSDMSTNATLENLPKNMIDDPIDNLNRLCESVIDTENKNVYQDKLKDSCCPLKDEAKQMIFDVMVSSSITSNDLQSSVSQKVTPQILSTESNNEMLQPNNQEDDNHHVCSSETLTLSTKSTFQDILPVICSPTYESKKELTTPDVCSDQTSLTIGINTSDSSVILPKKKDHNKTLPFNTLKLKINQSQKKLKLKQSLLKDDKTNVRSKALQKKIVVVNLDDAASIRDNDDKQIRNMGQHEYILNNYQGSDKIVNTITSVGITDPLETNFNDSLTILKQSENTSFSTIIEEKPWYSSTEQVKPFSTNDSCIPTQSQTTHNYANTLPPDIVNNPNLEFTHHCNNPINQHILQTSAGISQEASSDSIDAEDLLTDPKHLINRKHLISHQDELMKKTSFFFAHAIQFSMSVINSKTGMIQWTIETKQFLIDCLTKNHTTSSIMTSRHVNDTSHIHCPCGGHTIELVIDPFDVYITVLEHPNPWVTHYDHSLSINTHATFKNGIDPFCWLSAPLTTLTQSHSSHTQHVPISQFHIFPCDIDIFMFGTPHHIEVRTDYPTDCSIVTSLRQTIQNICFSKKSVPLFQSGKQYRLSTEQKNIQLSYCHSFSVNKTFWTKLLQSGIQLKDVLITQQVTECIPTFSHCSQNNTSIDTVFWGTKFSDQFTPSTYHSPIITPDTVMSNALKDTNTQGIPRKDSIQSIIIKSDPVPTKKKNSSTRLNCFCSDIPGIPSESPDTHSTIATSYEQAVDMFHRFDCLGVTGSLLTNQCNSIPKQFITLVKKHSKIPQKPHKSIQINPLSSSTVQYCQKDSTSQKNVLDLTSTHRELLSNRQKQCHSINSNLPQQIIYPPIETLMNTSQLCTSSKDGMLNDNLLISQKDKELDTMAEQLPLHDLDKTMRMIRADNLQERLLSGRTHSEKYSVLKKNTTRDNKSSCNSKLIQSKSQVPKTDEYTPYKHNRQHDINKVDSKSLFVLKIQLTDDHYEDIIFSNRSDIESKARHFLNKFNIRSEFLEGLVSCARCMIQHRKDNSFIYYDKLQHYVYFKSVDIADLFI